MVKSIFSIIIIISNSVKLKINLAIKKHSSNVNQEQTIQNMLANISQITEKKIQKSGFDISILTN